MAERGNNDLLKVFKEANEVTFTSEERMNEIYKFLTENGMFPISGTKSIKVNKLIKKSKIAA